MGPAKPEEWPSDTKNTKLARLHPYAIVRRSIPSAVKERMPCKIPTPSILPIWVVLKTPTPNALFIYLVSMTKFHNPKAKVQNSKLFFQISSGAMLSCTLLPHASMPALTDMPSPCQWSKAISMYKIYANYSDIRLVIYIRSDSYIGQYFLTSCCIFRPTCNRFIPKRTNAAAISGSCAQSYQSFPPPPGLQDLYPHHLGRM